MPSGISLGVVILAAGRSSRMGRPKLLLPWGDVSILGHLLRLWCQFPADQLAVVCAHHDAAIQAELDRLRLEFPGVQSILNPDPDRGMFSSIQSAALWTGWDAVLTHWAIVLGDQPHLQSATLDALVRFAAAHPGSLCQPAHRGRARHPVILPADIFRELPGTHHATLKEFLQPHAARLQLLELPDPGLDFDLDYPADYEQALFSWRDQEKS